MTAAAAFARLEPLLGTDIGTGKWSLLSPARIRMFAAATSQPFEVVPTMMLLSLVPGLTATIKLPIDPPLTSVNYGLDFCRAGKPARVGERVKARATLLAIDDGGTWLQLKRRVILENEAGEQVLEADALTRLYW